MLKTILNMLAGALICAGVGGALAVTGTVPERGFALVDGAWLRGLAAGINYDYQNSVTATGTTQATAAQLPANRYLVQIDTASASTGVTLPPCYAGTQIFLFNNGLQTVTVYPAVANNATLTPPAQDTINNTTSVTVASRTPEMFMCAKNGTWAAK